ncbi:MAG: hypothetical protein AB2765_18035 [Candidatus Thiodiazotropha endolucinida]
MEKIYPPVVDSVLRDAMKNPRTEEKNRSGELAIGPRGFGGQYSSPKNKEITIKAAKETFSNLIDFADYEWEFAKHICKTVIDRYGSNDDLSALMMKRLRVERNGKPNRKRKYWDNSRYKMLLESYRALRQQDVPKKIAYAKLVPMTLLSR